MPELMDAKAGTDMGAQGTAAPAQDPAPALPSAPDHTLVKGRFNQYTSGYWALALPALAARYVARYALAFSGVKPESPALKTAYAGIVGAWMSFVTGLYAVRTFGDMKRIFAETVAWESGKKPEDVGFRDLWNSKNVIVDKAMRNYIGRNLLRTGVSLSFFARFVPGKHFQNKEADSVDLGVGAAGAYLTSDVLLRKETFFERLQSVIDTKINHNDRLGEVITATDLMNLYDRHARDKNSGGSGLERLWHKVAGGQAEKKDTNYSLPKMNTQEWRDDQVLFGRMAELMNKTYGNAVVNEHADYTIPKLLYLLGNGLVKSESLEKNLAYVEVANLYGIPAVEKLAQAVGSGGPDALHAALAAYPEILGKLKQETSLAVTPADNVMLTSMGIAPVMEQPAKSFASEALKKARPEAPPVAQVDKVTQGSEAGAGAMLGV